MRKDIVEVVVLAIILLVLVGVTIALLLGGGCSHTTEKKGIYTDTIPYYDTITVYYPIPKDSVVIRYETIKVPVEAKPDTTKSDTAKRDSVKVQIPITQKKYEGEQYRAYVSGYHPSLDSIFIYPKNSVIKVKERRKRFVLGVTAGYGVGKGGLTPYVGVGVTYKLWEF